MPTDACQWFYECEQCHTLLKPKAGGCCVFCSCDVPCPPIQTNLISNYSAPPDFPNACVKKASQKGRSRLRKLCLPRGVKHMDVLNDLQQ